MKNRSHVLVIAGSDSSGGAGIARDLAVLSHFGVGASLAITAVTAQTHNEVVAVEVMPAPLVAAQMRTALAAGRIAAIKVGMLATAAIVEAIADVLALHPGIPVVLDPVIASTSGTRLLSDAGVERLKHHFLQLASLVTPNLPELSILTEGKPASADAAISTQAARLHDWGCPNVLVKGGHAEGPQSIDTLHTMFAPPRLFASPRREVALRGTGCMLSSAIAANLALEHDIPTAISRAKAFMDDRFEEASGRLSNSALDFAKVR